MRKTIEWRGAWEDDVIALAIEKEVIVTPPDADISIHWYLARDPVNGRDVWVEPMSRGYTNDRGKDMLTVTARDILSIYREALSVKAEYSDREPWELETIAKLSMMEAMGAL